MRQIKVYDLTRSMDTGICSSACGGVAVRPGDLIVGDDDGIVVVAAGIAEAVIDWVEEHEQAEEYIKALIESENVAPGKYYNTQSFERLAHERPWKK